MERHWSFVVCDKRYLYPLVGLILVVGVVAAFITGDRTHVSRVGNFIIGTGVWMSMRYSLREGLSRSHDANDSLPVLPGQGPVYALNPRYFAKLSAAFGDALLQVHGFVLVLAGSTLSSYGDILIGWLFPGQFP